MGGGAIKSFYDHAKWTTPIWLSADNSVLHETFPDTSELAHWGNQTDLDRSTPSFDPRLDLG